jgi:hypothetical protein
LFPPQVLELHPASNAEEVTDALTVNLILDFIQAAGNTIDGFVGEGLRIGMCGVGKKFD